MTKEFRLFIPITKIDEAKRLVYGVMTQEVPDASGEIMDYATGKPEFEKWSQETHDRSGGKSKGNIRAMHSAIAAGKLTDINFDDHNKTIEGVAKIVDDAEWNKVLEGVYTGFSIGGSYLKRWTDPENPKFIRYTPSPSEVSIVDNPCCPTATFSMVKADGTTIQKAFKHIKETPMDKEALRKAAGAKLQQGWLTEDNTFYPKRDDAIDHDLLALEKREFSDKKRKELADKGHAMPEGEYPIENEKDLENAIKAFGRAKEDEKEAVKEHITRRAKELKATDKLPADWEGSTKDKSEEKKEKVAKLKKGMHQVARVACIIGELDWLAEELEIEEVIEGDDSQAHVHLEAIIRELIEFLENLVQEECSEIEEGHEDVGVEEVMVLAASIPSGQLAAITKKLEKVEKFKKLLALLAKAGARHSAYDLKEGGALHKTLGEMKEHLDGVHKCLGKMHKVHGEMDECHKEMEECHKSADKEEMGEHVEDAKKCMGKLHKLHKNMEDHHEHLADLHKEAIEHSEAVGFGSNSGGHVDPATANEKVQKFTKSLVDSAIKKVREESYEENESLKKQHSEELKKRDDLINDVMGRLKKLEAQPMPGKGAVFAVTKGHESSQEPDKTVEAEPAHSFTRGMSPADARKTVFNR